MLLHTAPNELDCEYCTKQTKLCHLNHVHVQTAMHGLQRKTYYYPRHSLN